MSAMYAARFPEKVASLILAGSPIDTDAGMVPSNGWSTLNQSRSTRNWSSSAGASCAACSCFADGRTCTEQVDLYEHIDDPAYIKKEEAFESWYENPLDFPGRWYLQTIRQIFRENRLANGTFAALGHTLNLIAITCPVYLLAGESGDITTREQVFDATKYLGTSGGTSCRNSCRVVILGYSWAHVR